MKICKKDRQELHDKLDGRCAYCGCELGARWHADHVEPVNRVMKFAKDKRGHTVMVATGEYYNPERDCIENLMPACGPCNIDKGNLSLESWRHGLERLPEVMRRNVANFRHAERFGIVHIQTFTVRFYFEVYEEQEAL